MNVARISIIFLAFVGTAFLGYERDAMKATTVAGMSIMGIGAPIWWMTVWRVKTENRKGWRQAPLTFIIPFAVGWFIGISYYIHGEDNTDRTLWCSQQTNPANDCVTSAQGWTFKLKVGTYTNGAGDSVSAAYSRYLGTMLVGHGIVIALFFIFFVFHQFVQIPFFECEEVLPVKEENEVELTKIEEKVMVEQTVIRV